MQITGSSFDSAKLMQGLPPKPEAKGANAQADSSEVRAAFDNVVGTIFYGQMLSAMRKTLDKPAYFHGGRGEEVFQQHLDQMFADEMTKASAHQLSEPMFAQFERAREVRR